MIFNTKTVSKSVVTNGNKHVNVDLHMGQNFSRTGQIDLQVDIHTGTECTES